LSVKLDQGEERRTVILRDDWVDTDVRVGDTINIIGPFTPLPLSPPPSPTSLPPPPTSTITLTSAKNLLILHPDTLLTATALSTASTCARKPLLSMLVHSSSDVTPSLVWGNVLHEVMQGCLRERQWSGGWIDRRIREVIVGGDGGGRGMADLVRLGVGVEQAVREVKARAGGLKTFGERYMAQNPKVRLQFLS
jgi:DNA replication ATP-dependent helicase Dna2